jgi:hypothetical protein
LESQVWAYAWRPGTFNCNVPTQPDITLSAATVCQHAPVIFGVQNPDADLMYVWTASAGTANGSSYTFNTASATAMLQVTASTTDATISTCQWMTGSGNGTPVGSNNKSYSVAATSNYWVVVTDSHSCATTSNPVTVTIKGRLAGWIGATCSAGWIKL